MGQLESVSYGSSFHDVDSFLMPYPVAFGLIYILVIRFLTTVHMLVFAMQYQYSYLILEMPTGGLLHGDDWIQVTRHNSLRNAGRHPSIQN